MSTRNIYELILFGPPSNFKVQNPKNPEVREDHKGRQGKYKDEFIKKYGYDEWNLRQRLYRINFKIAHGMALSKSEIELRKENR